MIYGHRASKIGNFAVKNTRCQFCESMDSQTVSVFGRYVHVMWIPIFPIGKAVVSECDSCKRTIKKKEFSPALQEQYALSKDSISTPKWHFLGLGIIGLLVILITITSATKEVDPRDELLSSDKNSMSLSPTMESDSTSFKIKSMFDEIVIDEMNAHQFEYKTKVVEDKALVLVKIPTLKQLDKEVRVELLEMIEMMVNAEKDLVDKEKYIGVFGKYSLMLASTPTYREEKNLATKSELNAFYGNKSTLIE